MSKNERLDALLDATKKWAAAERARLEEQVVLNKKLLKGRTGMERLAQEGVQATAAVVVDEISQFLEE